MRKTLLLVGAIAYTLSLHATEKDYTNRSYAVLTRAFEQQPATLLLETRLDLTGCDETRIRDAEDLTTLIEKLGSIVGGFDPGSVPHIVHRTSPSSGYTFVHISGNATIAGYVINATNTVHVTIMSTALYNPTTAAQYAIKFLHAHACATRTVVRS